jgi:tetratricopeptide (TPR) repeat protein
MRQLNARFLLFLIVAAVVLSSGLFLLHRAQSGRIARAVRRQAERAEGQGQRDQQVKYLSRYLEFVPSDNDTRAELGRILADPETPASPRQRERAAFVLEQVLLREPDRHDSRRLLVRVALQLGRPDLANEHLLVLEKSLPDDGEVLALRGQWYEARNDERTRDADLAKAAAFYYRAITRAPQDIDSHVRLAYLLARRPALREQVDPKTRPTGEDVMDRLVANNADSVKAWLARWQFHQQFYELDDAEELARAGASVARALELAPDEAGVLKAAAQLARLQGNRGEARRHLERGLQLHAADGFLYQELARLELEESDREVEKSRELAINCLRRGIRSVAAGPAQNELTWTLANLLIDDGKLDEAEAALGQLRKARFAPAGADFLAARLAVQKGQWVEAARLLERARPLLETEAELGRQADLLLAQCYERLDEPAARRLPVYQRLLQRDPNSAAARQLLAASLFANGRHDEALEQYRQLAALPDAPPNAWAQVARLLLLRGAERGQADWREVESALERAEKAEPGAVEVTMLRCELLYAQRKEDKARKLLEERRGREPKRVAWYAALAELDQRQKQPEEARRRLTEAEKECGDSVELRLAWARFWSAQGGDEAKQAIVRLADRLNDFSADEQSRLLLGLVEAQCRLADFQQAEQLWGRLARQERFADDLRVQQLWFDLALQAGVEDSQKAALETIRRLEQGEGPLWHYGQALRLIRLARQGQKEVLDEAHTHLEAAAGRRPAWAAVQVARAQVDALKGNAEQAVSGYRRAMELGERGLQVTRELVQLLHRLGRFPEAEQEITRLGRQVEQSPELKRLAADISLQNQDPARAVQLALKAVAADSNDYRDHLWLGQIRAAGGPDSAAEAAKSLRRAYQLAPEVPETLVALVRFLAANEQTKEAKQLLAQGEAKLPAGEAPLALAQCWEALQEFDQAQKYYQAALAARPRDMAVLRGAAAFYLRVGRLDQAEPLLRPLTDRKVEAPPGDVAWARRALAQGLANFADYRRFGEALALLGLRLEEGKVVEERQPADDELAEELRARARVLVTANRKPLRQAAIAFLEDLNRRQPLSVEDQFLLAQLYEANGPQDRDSWGRARTLLQAVTAAPNANPLHLAHAARSHLRRGDPDDRKAAERLLDRLEQLEKARRVEAGAFGSVELRAQLWETAAEQQTREQAVELLRRYAERPNAAPEDVLLRVGCLARLGRLDEALDVCDRAWASCPPEAVGGASVAALRAGKPNPGQCARVERALRAALEKGAGNSVLLLHLADVCDLQQHYPEAQRCYRQVLEKEPGNVVALNNLAWLLAHAPAGAAEGLALIERAVQLVGPRPELLDTRALVHLALNRPDRAIADLERLNNESPSGPRYFHLARAHQAAKNREEAKAALLRATKSGFRPEQLHPMEQVAYQKIVTELSP